MFNSFALQSTASPVPEPLVDCFGCGGSSGSEEGSSKRGGVGEVGEGSAERKKQVDVNRVGEVKHADGSTQDFLLWFGSKPTPQPKTLNRQNTRRPP